MSRGSGPLPITGHLALPEGPEKAPMPSVGLSHAHPLAGSVAAVDQAGKSTSFRLWSFRLWDWPGNEVTSHQESSGERDTEWPSGEWPSGEWTSCAQALCDPDYFTRWRSSVAAVLAEQYTEVPERTTAGCVLQRYLGIPSYLGAMLFHSARRVPSLQPGQLAFRIERGRVRQVALRPGPFWCLPSDPDAGHPDAIPVPDEAALGAELRREVVSHADCFLCVYGPLVRFGRRTLWAAVTDALDTGLLLAGRMFGSAEAGAADARLVLAARVEPLSSASTICEVTDEHGRTHWTRRRGSCCFCYALPGVQEPCVTCPRTDDIARARLLGQLDQP